MERRVFLKGASLGMVGLGSWPGFLDRALAASGGVSASSSKKKALVVIFQRGAVDGLAMVPPIGDKGYAGARPNLALSMKGEDAAKDLDGFFALHPALAPLVRPWSEGRLLIVHQAGSPDPTRSHFDAQDFMESGTPGKKSTEDGYLNRLLRTLPGDAGSTLRGVAVQPNLPRSLRGVAPALALTSLKDFARSGALDKKGLRGGFESMYKNALDEALRGVGSEAFRALHALDGGDRSDPSDRASYPDGPLGKRLREIAKLIRADVGLEIAATEMGGFDTHVGQGAARGSLANRLKELGSAIAAFAEDLGPRMEDVLLVTMTEFGRTVRENGNGGTDHGHGSVMLLLGGAISGKRVLARWKGLAGADLFEGRDLPVAHDFRQVMLEVFSSHLGMASAAEPIFPGFKPGASLGLFRA